MTRQKKRPTRTSDYSAYRYCVFAVHLSEEWGYWYDPAHKLFFRGFSSEADRQKYWRTVVEQNTVAKPGRAYQLSLVDVGGTTRSDCSAVEVPRYADSPVIDGDVDHSSIKTGLVNCSDDEGTIEVE